MVSKKLKQYAELLSFEETLTTYPYSQQQPLSGGDQDNIIETVETDTTMTARKLEEFINLIETAEKISITESAPPKVTGYILVIFN